MDVCASIIIGNKSLISTRLVVIVENDSIDVLDVLSLGGVL